MKVGNGKRILAYVLSFIMLLSICAVSAPQQINAAEKVIFTLSADQTELHRGDTVTYTVTVSGNETGVGSQIRFDYDSSRLEYQTGSAKTGTIKPNVDDAFGTMNDTTVGMIKQVVVSAYDLLNNGVAFTATFKVKDDAPAGTVVTSLSENQITNEEYQNVDSEVVNNAAYLAVLVPATGISLNKSTLSLEKGSSEKLTATLTPADASDTVSWSSSNSSVATVAADGTVTAVANGNAKITATVGNYSASCDVTVVTSLKSISIKGTTDTIKKGQTTQLQVTYDPEDTTDDKTVTWSSADATIASVDATGLVTALKDGTTTIKATVGSKTAEYTINVQEIKLTGISIADEQTIHRGETGKLAVIYTPENTTDDKTVTWSSSNASVASVAKDGTITANAIGSAVITATVGTHEDTCTVTVDAPLKSIVPEKTKIELVKNQSADLSYSLNPTDTTDSQEVTFTSADPTIVSVDASGKMTAKKAGTTTITLAGANNIKADVEVIVTEIPINQVVLNIQSKNVEIGETVALTATILPENNTDDDQSITWKSSDDSIATVAADSADGSKATVTAVKGGTVTISATASNGTEATCTIKVLKHIESIALPSDAKILRGKPTVLDLTINPEDTDDEVELTWSSDNEDVAKVDGTTGEITGIKAGTANITVTATVVGQKTRTSFTDTKEITIVENSLSDAIAEDMVFNETTKVFYKGQKLNLNSIFNLQSIVEENQITDDITVEWTSSDESVATVDENGDVTFLKEGKTVFGANVTAIDGSGNKVTYSRSAEYEVQEIPLESIAFDKVITEMKVGDTATLGILYNPENTTDDRTAEWKSSNPDVISVEDGVLTAKAAGTATITATVGNHSTECKITVKKAKTNTPDNNSKKDVTAGVTQVIAPPAGQTVNTTAATSPKTADGMPIGLYAGMLLFGMAAAAYGVKRKGRRA